MDLLGRKCLYVVEVVKSELGLYRQLGVGEVLSNVRNPQALACVLDHLDLLYLVEYVPGPPRPI